MLSSESYKDHVRKRREYVLKYTLEGYTAAEIAISLKEQYQRNGSVLADICSE